MLLCDYCRATYCGFVPWPSHPLQYVYNDCELCGEHEHVSNNDTDSLKLGVTKQQIRDEAKERAVSVNKKEESK